MALTSAQLLQLRYMVIESGSPSYAAQVAASDDFALSELAKWLPVAIATAQSQIADFGNSLQNAQTKLTILQAQ